MKKNDARDVRTTATQLYLPFDPSARERLAMLVKFEDNITKHTESAK